MPDISMCDNQSCPHRTRCYRNPASGTKPNVDRQAWSYFEKAGSADNPENCTGWMPIYNQINGDHT